MERQHIAYLLIAVMLVAATAWVAYAWHNTRARKYARRKVRERAAQDDLMALKLTEQPPI